MQRLSRDLYTTILDPQLPPAMTVASGETFLVETWDAYMGAWNVGEEPQATGPATGPVAVEGASPGDALCIEILTIEPGQAAMHDVRAGRGFLGDVFTERRPTVMAIEEGHLLFPGGVKIPTRPSIGLIATTPLSPQSAASDSGAYGGDLDIQELTAGSTLWLPVFVPGGLLVVGDCHAVVGDGAVGGTGAECAAELTLRITIEQAPGIKRPRALTSDHFMTIAYAEELTQAMQHAVQDMVDFLVQEKGMAPYDAYSLLSLAGDVRMSRTLREISPVKMMLARDILNQLG